MIELTELKFKAITADKEHKIKNDVSCQLCGLKYRDDMEEIVFQEDVADNFLDDIREKYDCTEWEDSDLINWIRDIQHDLIEKFASSSTVTLSEFIAEKFNSQADFAEKQGVKRQQVTQWLNKDFIVVDGRMYSGRRDLSS